MGYLDQCRACDVGNHDGCDGTVIVMDQDGRSSYICQCLCRRWQAECPACPEWKSGGHIHRSEAEKAFDRHVQNDHRPEVILTQPDRGKVNA